MFTHRIAYGCWLNDSRLKPIADENWPSVRIDEGTLHSLQETAAFLKTAGYNYLDVFGLVTNHSWAPDIGSTITKERAEAVRKVIDVFHQQGIRLIYGLGVYSWGFERIIQEVPGVRGTSAQVMCASAPESEAVMHKVINYLMANFDLDGFHLEAADQGRCHCEQCQKISDDIDYYNHINALVAAYIRKKWPEKLLLVNTSGYLAWGDRFNEKQLGQIEQLAKVVDVFIDVGSHGPFVDEPDRPGLIKRMEASFGTANGFWIYPPQRWERDRWFLPHCVNNLRHLKALYVDGGRSAELFLSPISNPGAEMTQMCNGIFMNQPHLTADEVMNQAVNLLYQPESEEIQKGIVDLFVKAEELFFACWRPQRDRSLPEMLSDGVEGLFTWSERQPEKAVPGEFFLEPLFGVGAGFPCYLTVHFDRQGRVRYDEGIRRLLSQANSLLKGCGHPRLLAIVACLANVREDIKTAQAAMGEETEK